MIARRIAMVVAIVGSLALLALSVIIALNGANQVGSFLVLTFVVIAMVAIGARRKRFRTGSRQ